MKKIFLILAIALGMNAMQACQCTSEKNVTAPEFVYDVVATAEGDGGYAFEWGKNAHTGVVSVDGTAVITVKATNDTTDVKVLTTSNCVNAPLLSDAVNSDDPDVAEAAQLAQSKLMLDLNLNGLKGKVALGLTGYVKYGMMVFALDEYWQYPPVEPVAPVDSVVVE